MADTDRQRELTTIAQRNEPPDREKFLAFAGFSQHLLLQRGNHKQNRKSKQTTICSTHILICTNSSAAIYRMQSISLLKSEFFFKEIRAQPVDFLEDGEQSCARRE
ncbi:MAG: hypothetical protein HYZ65_04445 [Burkholderiales bacterium]|nr:hypothetical protein [Burkholderiales bacterium]